MRAWTFDAFGLDQLRLGEHPDPRPGPGEVLLAVRAVSLNYRDLMMVRGQYNPRQPLPLVPCSDAVAEVAELGEGVRTLAIGDRVCPFFSQSWLDGPPSDAMLRGTLGGPLDGTLRERMVVPATAVARAPAHLSDVQCATLPCAAVTAWRALVTEGGVGAGDTVLTLGTGGVSVFAVQLATALGAKVVVTSSSDDKLARAMALGAVHGVNYVDEPAWGKAIHRWSGGGVDHVVELGGTTLEQSLRAVRVGGQISIIGVLGGAQTPLALTRILMRHVRLQGIFVGSGRDARALMDFLVAHPEVQPVVSQVVPFERAPEAFELLAKQGQLGKVVVKVGEYRS